MEISQILLHASQLVYENVKDMAGTDDAAGDFGTGAGGDISRNIDITAEILSWIILRKLILNVLC